MTPTLEEQAETLAAEGHWCDCNPVEYHGREGRLLYRAHNQPPRCEAFKAQAARILAAFKAVEQSAHASGAREMMARSCSCICHEDGEAIHAEGARGALNSAAAYAEEHDCFDYGSRIAGWLRARATQ